MPNLSIEEALEMFAIFGGTHIALNLKSSIDNTILENIVDNYRELERGISPSYLLEKPYRDVLVAISRGDGKVLNIFKRARLSETVGRDILRELRELDIIYVTPSRERPLKTHPKQKLKRHLRSYRIQSKVYFREPFMRFWFGFVEPYRRELSEGNTTKFWKNFKEHKERSLSLTFEQLSNDLIEVEFQKRDPLIQKGNHWDRYSEFDVLCLTSSRKILLGECKYKGRKICQNELSKLKEKATRSGIVVDNYILFSLNGFSKKLLQNRDKNLLLFEAKDFLKLL